MSHQNDEAEKLYYTIFKKKIPADLKRYFSGASKILESGYLKNDIKRYHRYLEKVTDLEALEFASRWFNQCPLLTDKFKIMISLAETLPENHQTFVNESTGKLFNWISIGITCLHSAWKLVKGFFLLKVFKQQ